MKRSRIDVGNVHGNLCDSILVDEPSDGFASLQCTRNHYGLAVLVLYGLAGDRIPFSLRSSFLAHIECNSIGTAGRGRVEVVIDSNEEIAGAYVCCSGKSCAFCIMSRSEIRLALRVAHLFRQGFIFACTADCKVLSLRLLRGGFIAVAWDFKFIIYAFRKHPCQFRALFEGNA